MQLFLIAHIAGRGVAIAAEQVDAVVDVSSVVAVPRSEPAIRGLVALRSRVVTVIDTGTALGFDPMPHTTRRAVITLVDGHPYAMLVDSLEDVASFEHQSLSSGLALDRGWRAAGRGIVERDGEPLLIVDLASLVPTGAAGLPVAA